MDASAVGIGFGDTTDTATDHAHLHLVVAQAVERPLQRFERTTHVGLEHDVERLLLVLTHGLEDVLELAGVSTGKLHFAELALTEQGDFAGLLLVGDHGEVVTGFRRTVQTKNLHRNGRTGFLHRLAILVEHGPHAAEVHTTQDHITLAQRTVLNRDGGDRHALVRRDSTTTPRPGAEGVAFSSESRPAAAPLRAARRHRYRPWRKPG